VVRQFERPNVVSHLLNLGARTDLRDRAALTVFDHLKQEFKRRPTQQAEYEKLRDALNDR